ncbi:MAG: carboxylate-amine ligase [Hyphomicrobiales bacterium]|nr:carboxylate-amine ligase [Hyphomicrobiales bacterium]
MSGFRFGIEEEYFVVHRRTASVNSSLSAPFMKAAKRKLGANLMYELLQSQIEVATEPVETAQAARQQLSYFRATLATIGADHNVGIVAAGTHPLALPQHQRMTPKRRYAKVAEELGMVAWGNPLCGLHVHVEVPAPERRVELMHRLIPHLPLLLALSTSSPFWAGCNTGLLGYRNAANDTFPRTGFPEMFSTMRQYESYVQALVDADIIRDSTYIWWALRPSLRHPTLELRITDCCTDIDDAVKIASLYRALVRNAVRRPARSREFCPITRALTEENRWRAQRYGTDGTYVDLATRRAISFSEFLAGTLEMVGEDAEDLGVTSELAGLSAILDRGTSAHQQLAMYQTLKRRGHPRPKALREVAKWLRASTEAGSLLEQPATLPSPRGGDQQRARPSLARVEEPRPPFEG